MMYYSMKQLGFLALSIAAVWAAPAHGQSSSYGQLSGYPAVNRPTSRLGRTPLTRPTVSPYLHLANQPRDASGIPRFGGVYQVLVRPQLDQQEFSVDQQREIVRIQADMLQMQNELHGAATTGARRTGHHSRFMSFSHFYPPGKQ
jgi:hypothetical protein